jgi:hypothetical protein
MTEKEGRWGASMQHSLNELEAFDAMRVFLEAFWRRGNCESDELRDLLSWLDRTPWPSGRQFPHLAGGPRDPAQWEDWLDAIEAMRAARKTSN